MKLTESSQWENKKRKCKKKTPWRARKKKKGGQALTARKRIPSRGHGVGHGVGQSFFSSVCFILGIFIKAWTALAGPADVGQERQTDRTRKMAAKDEREGSSSRYLFVAGILDL